MRSKIHTQSQILKHKNVTSLNNRNNFSDLNSFNKDKFEQELLNINIKKPKNAFNFFVTEFYNKSNGKLGSFISEFAEKYKKLPDEKKKKYEKMADDDKKRYENHMQLVRTFLIEKPIKENVTAYYIYKNERLQNEKNPEATELKKLKETWKNLPKEEKKIYREKLKTHQEFYNSIHESFKPITAYRIFLQDEMEKSNEQIIRKDLRSKWDDLEDKQKEKYASLAEDMKDDLQGKRKLYMLAYGMKPKKPNTALRYFAYEMKKLGKIKNAVDYKEIKILWEKIYEAEREKYLKKQRKEQLEYTILKREYEKRKEKAKGPSAYNLFMSDLKGIQNKEYSEQGFFNFVYSKWKDADEVTKKKYFKLAKIKKMEIEEKLDLKVQLEKLGRGPNGLSVFRHQKFNEYKFKFPNKTAVEYFTIMLEDYKKLSEPQKEEYNQKAEKEREKIKQQKEILKGKLTELYKIPEKTLNESKVSLFSVSIRRSKVKSLKKNDKKSKSKRRSLKKNLIEGKSKRRRISEHSQKSKKTVSERAKNKGMEKENRTKSMIPVKNDEEKKEKTKKKDEKIRNKRSTKDAEDYDEDKNGVTRRRKEKGKVSLRSQSRKNTKKRSNSKRNRIPK